MEETPRTVVTLMGANRSEFDITLPELIEDEELAANMAISKAWSLCDCGEWCDYELRGIRHDG